MKLAWKITILSGLILVFGGLVYFHINQQKTINYSINTDQTDDNGKVAGTSTTSGEDTYTEKLAKFLTQKGFILYGAYWSDDVNKQKALFGKSVQYLDYVECDQAGVDANPDECVAQKISQYPTWMYQGAQYTGVKSLSELAKIAGF